MPFAASGGDPTPILVTLTTELVIRRHSRPGNIVATLDALHAERGLARYAEVAWQAANGSRHGGAITSLCLRFPGKLDWHSFGLWFSMLAHQHGDKLLRVKGIPHVEDSETPVAIHAVQHVIHAPEHLPDWPDAEHGSRIVFIAQGLEPDAVEGSLHAFYRLTRPATKAVG